MASAACAAWHVLLIFILLSECSQSAITNTLSELLDKAKQNGGIIEGNPLLYPECRNALLDRHKSSLSYLQQLAIPTPWFWSRESIDAVSKNLALRRRTKLTYGDIDAAKTVQQYLPLTAAMSYDYAHSAKAVPRDSVNWYLHLGEQVSDEITVPLPVHALNYSAHRNIKGDVHSGRTCFYHIEKSGSSSIAGMMHDYQFNTTYTSENVRFHCECGFTFLRDPISRFVSGYYTINKLIYWYHHHLKRIGKKGPDMSSVPNTFRFWNISGEPERMMQFIHDLWDYSFEFTRTTPLEHVMTQSGLLSVPQVDIHYIGDVSQLMEHLQIIKNKCAQKTGNAMLLQQELVEKHIMTNFGTKWMEELRPWYTDMLSLDSYEAGDLDPAYLAIADNYDLYQKIVEFYRQDYVCFGFEHDWIKFRHKVYRKRDATKLRKHRKRINDTKSIIK